MSKSHPRTMRLLETTYSTPANIDKEAGIIPHVKVLGRESKNGRTYSDRALDDAAKLYEGAEVNVDHPDRKQPDRERGVMEGYGVLKNTKRESDGVYADLHYLKSHGSASVIVERVERGFPIGLSHNADGKVNQRGKKTMVESIHRVHSVDLVRNPATNKNLFESENRTMEKTVREILEAEFPGKTAGCKLLEMDDGAMAAMPVDVPAEGSSDDQIWSAFKASIMAVVDDDSMDTKSTLKKIGEILKAYDKLSGSATSGGESGGATGGGSAEKKPVAESTEVKTDPQLTALLESVNRIERRETARGLMDEFSIGPDSALLESLVKLPTETEMRKLCEREAKLRPAKSKGKPLMESKYQQEAVAKYPADSKSFVSSLR